MSQESTKPVPALRPYEIGVPSHRNTLPQQTPKPEYIGPERIEESKESSETKSSEIQPEPKESN